MNISRTKFIEKIHQEIYNEDLNDNEIIIFKDRSFVVEQGDNINAFIEKSKKDLNNIINKVLGTETDTFNDAEIINKMKTNIVETFGDLAFSYEYNKLYDDLIEKNIIKNDNIVQVYRIENDNNFGIYTHFRHEDKNLMSMFDNISSNTPSPMEDSVLRSVFGNIYYDREESRKWIFGFSDISTLKKWMSSDEDMTDYIMANSDLHVNVYEVKEKDILTSKKQLAYIKTNEKPIKQLKLNDILNNYKVKKDYDENISKKSNDSKEVINFLKEKDGDTRVITKKRTIKNKTDKRQLKLF